MTITENARIYTTDTIDLGDDMIPAGTEGTVAAFTGHDGFDLLIEFDAGFLTAINSGDVALV